MKGSNKKQFWIVGGVFMLVAAFFLAPPAEKEIPEGQVKSVRELGLSDEGSGTLTPPPQKEEPVMAEGSGTEFSEGLHPASRESEKIERGVFVPEIVKGKWKAVKILVKNKMNEEFTEMKTVGLGTSFGLGDSGLKVTVGPYFPNFVMDKNVYTSMTNEEWNPAVQLVVEDKEKILYKGWTFKKFPNLYAFEHDTYSLELVGSVPMEIS